LAEAFKVAHLKEQGVDLVIVFVNPSVGNLSPLEQQQAADALQRCAASAGLAGNVAMVWQNSAGRMEFWAPNNQHAYFLEVPWDYLVGNINKTLTCAF
jgi:hypothetical protein